MEQHYFKQFTRVNEAVHSESLKADELVSCENMRLDDEIAAAVSRKGFDRYNQQVNSSGVITSLFDVEDQDQNNYLLAQIGTVLRKSLNGSEAYSTIKTGLTNAKLRMAIYGEKFYFTNNEEVPFLVEGDLATVSDLVIERPDITSITVTENNTTGGIFGNLIHHQYMIQYVTDTGEFSNVSKPFMWRTYLADPNETPIQNITMANIPVSSDSRVTSKRIYRTKLNDFSNFYLLATIDNNDTTYTDNAEDDALDLSETPVFYNIPDKAKYITSNNERIILGNVTKTLNNIVKEPFYLPSPLTYIVDDTAAGNLSAGTYKWAVSFVDKNGNESALTEFIENTQGASTSMEYLIDTWSLLEYERSESISLFGRPLITLQPSAWILDQNIKYFNIYRTKANGSTFYYRLSLQPELCKDTYNIFSGNTITDSGADSLLTDEYPASTPFYNAKYAATQQTLPSSLIYSELFKPLEYPELNIIQVFPDDNDPITGVFNDDNGVIVFKERSICKLYTNGDPVNWQTTKLVEDVGCDEPNSIYKYGDMYYFYYKKRPYEFDGRNVKNIGETRRDTFDSVTAINGATFWHDAQFYILAVQIGTDHYLMCYDTKLEGWYKWSVSKASDIITKRFGSDKDKILLGRNTYVTYYNEDIDYDNDTGARVDIQVSLKTKDYRVDGFVNQRLWMLFLDYRKRLNRSNDNIIFTLTDPDKPTALRTYNDNSSTVVRNRFKIPTDAMVGTMKRARIINLSFTGTSMDQFINGRLDYMPEIWGVERRDPGAISGLGVSHGSEAGVSD